MPTQSDGTILQFSEQYEIELKKAEAERSHQKIVLRFSIGNGSDPEKKVILPNYIISNKFPNNVLMTRSGDIILCSDIEEIPLGSKTFVIIGFKFKCKENAFVLPYESSTYQTYLVSKIDNRVGEWNLNSISCKMYPFPFKIDDFSILPNIFVSSNKWFVTPIRHTIEE